MGFSIYKAKFDIQTQLMDICLLIDTYGYYCSEYVKMFVLSSNLEAIK